MYTAHPDRSGQQPGRGCRFYGILFFVGLPVLLLVMGVLVFVGRERSARSRLNQRLDEIKAQGFPVDHESLQSYYESLTSAEDTDTWLAALDEIASDAFVQSTKGVSGFDGSEIPAPGQLWAEEETTRRFLNKSRQLHGRVMRLSFKQLEEGVLPVRFPLVFKLVPTPPPNTQHLQQAAQLLHLNGRVAVYDRDSKGARRSIESLLGCSEVLTGDPTAISGWVATAIDGMALNVLKLALEFDVLDEGDLVGISRQLLDKATVAPHWQLSIVGERALALPYIEDSSLIARSHSTFASGRSVDALCYLDHADRVLDIRSDDLDEFLVGLRKRESEVQRLRDGILARNDSIVTRMVTIPLSSSFALFRG